MSNGIIPLCACLHVISVIEDARKFKDNRFYRLCGLFCARGILNKHINDTIIVIDHNKVKRAQEKLAKEFDKEFDDTICKDGVSCLFLDGR